MHPHAFFAVTLSISPPKLEIAASAVPAFSRVLSAVIPEVRTLSPRIERHDPVEAHGACTPPAKSNDCGASTYHALVCLNLLVLASFSCLHFLVSSSRALT